MLVLISYSFEGNCRLSYGSLKKICLIQYQKDKTTLFSHNTNSTSVIAVENFHFTNIKQHRLFFITDCCQFKYKISDSVATSGVYCLYGDCAHFRFYLVNKKNGSIPDLSDVNVFNSLMRKSKKRISNLDKCYFYLFLNHFESYWLLGPEYYAKAINNKSYFIEYDKIHKYSSDIFAWANYDKITNSGNSITDKDNIIKRIKNSNENDIYIYKVTRSNEVLSYRFTYGENNDLVSVKKSSE